MYQEARMKDEPEKINRRRFLITATTVIGGVGLVTLAIPFINYMKPAADTIAAGEPVDVDISKVEPGMMLTVRWRGRPVWVLRRTEEQLKVLQEPGLVKRLIDPDSQEAQQYGADVANWYRSLKPEYLVIVGICTHLGCVPFYRPDIASMDLGPTWPGGFFCVCHGSRYDLSGRVFKNMPAPLNLPVVPYYFKSETLIRVGELSDKSGRNWAPITW